MSIKLSESGSLPQGWVSSTLGEVCSDPQYGWTTSASKQGEVHLLRTTDITQGDIKWDSVPFCKECPKDVEKYLLKDGDIVISRAGSVGYSYLVRNPQKSIFASYLIRFKPLINKIYLSLFLKSPIYWKSISEKSVGIALANVNASKLKQIVLPIAPLPEQARIANKVELLFSFLDAGVAQLRLVQGQLKRYRQAVLKAAFEGKLTQQWREVFMTEEGVDSHVVLGNVPYTNSGLQKQLPATWKWIKLNDACSKIQDGTHFSPKSQFKEKIQNTYLYITAKNIKENGIDLSDVTYIDSAYHKTIYKRCNPEKNDVLLIKDGVKTGIATLNTLDEPFSLLSSVALFKPKRDVLYPLYLKHFFNSPLGMKITVGKMTGTAIKRIILDKLRKSFIPLASFNEQEQIIKEIELRLSVADNISTTIQNELRKSSILRSTILSSAFEGKLVCQDMHDQPAQMLLERIKAERLSNKPKNNQLELSKYVK